MPATYSHQIFCEQVYKNLPQNIKDKIKYKDYFYFGAQGGDILYLYRPILNLKNTSYGVLLHRHSVLEVFEKLSKYLRENKEDDFAYSFIFGYLTHYAMDTCFHPYVYYMDKKEREKAILKRRRKDKIHYLMEADFDVFLVEKYKVDDIIEYEFPLTKQSIESEKIFKPLKVVFDEVYKTKFKERAFQLCVRSYFRMNRFLNDKNNFKRRFFHRLERIFFITHRLSYLIRRKETNPLYLNLEKEKWHNIHDETVASSESVFEIFEKAKEIAIDLSIKLEESVEKGKKLSAQDFNKNLNTGILNKSLNDTK